MLCNQLHTPACDHTPHTACYSAEWQPAYLLVSFCSLWSPIVCFNAVQFTILFLIYIVFCFCCQTPEQVGNAIMAHKQLWCAFGYVGISNEPSQRQVWNWEKRKMFTNLTTLMWMYSKRAALQFMAYGNVKLMAGIKQHSGNVAVLIPLPVQAKNVQRSECRQKNPHAKCKECTLWRIWMYSVWACTFLWHVKVSVLINLSVHMEILA